MFILLTIIQLKRMKWEENIDLFMKLKGDLQNNCCPLNVKFILYIEISSPPKLMMGKSGVMCTVE